MRGFLVGAIVLGWLAAAEAKHPNIVYILADDFGWGDASCYNPEGKIETPFIDALAAGGMRFTDAHSPSAVCTPTRYGILTGRYSWRTRLKYRVLDGFDPPLIEKERVTVPSFLRSQGYATACIGKWHLGMEWTDKEGVALPAVPIDRSQPPRPGFEVDFSVPVRGGPVEVGFDYFFGISASLNMSPFCFIENTLPVVAPTLHHEKVATEFLSVDEGVRSPDFTIAGVMPRFAGETVKWIEERAAGDRPFFLYAPLSSPHLPVIPNAEYRGRSEAGEYGDFVVETDAFVGAVLDVLERTGIAGETLVIFTSDNGGLYHWWEPEEADDVANYKASARGEAMKALGHQGNAHWRGTKADVWEGGHRVPLVMRWPGRVPAGTVSEELVELTDLLATCAAIVGEDLPDGAGEDSRNMLPAMVSVRPMEPVREFAVHHTLWGHFAIRQGEWKMAPKRGSGGFSRNRTVVVKPGEPEGQLYNLKEDPRETRNLWNEKPEVVERLMRLLEGVKGDTADGFKEKD